jgi:hypothetical protein
LTTGTKENTNKPDNALSRDVNSGRMKTMIHSTKTELVSEGRIRRTKEPSESTKKTGLYFQGYNMDILRSNRWQSFISN